MSRIFSRSVTEASRSLRTKSVWSFASASIAASSCGNCTPMSCICLESAASDSDSFCRSASLPGVFLPAMPLAASWSFSRSFFSLSSASGVPVGVPICFCKDSICFCKPAAVWESVPVPARAACSIFLSAGSLPISLSLSLSFSATLARSLSASLRVKAFLVSWSPRLETASSAFCVGSRAGGRFSNVRRVKSTRRLPASLMFC